MTCIQQQQQQKCVNPFCNRDSTDSVYPSYLGGKYCDDCGREFEEDHELTYCDNCGVYCEEGYSAQVGSDAPICVDCLDDLYTQCSDCYEFVLKDDAITCCLDDGAFCDECAEEKCAHCGAYTDSGLHCLDPECHECDNCGQNVIDAMHIAKIRGYMWHYHDFSDDDRHEITNAIQQTEQACIAKILGAAAPAFLLMCNKRRW